MALVGFTIRGERWNQATRKAYEFGGMSEVNDLTFRRNERRVDILRAEAGWIVRNSLDRPGQSTGRLERATVSRNNTLVTPLQFGIGRRDWLDSAAGGALYWRQIEEGFGGHVGRRIRLPGRFRTAGGWTTMKALPPTRGRTREQDPSIRSVSWGPTTIKKAIRPHNIYGELMAQGKPAIREDLIQNARDYLRGVMGVRR